MQVQFCTAKYSEWKLGFHFWRGPSSLSKNRCAQMRKYNQQVWCNKMKWNAKESCFFLFYCMKLKEIIYKFSRKFLSTTKWFISQTKECIWICRKISFDCLLVDFYSLNTEILICLHFTFMAKNSNLLSWAETFPVRTNTIWASFWLKLLFKY